MIRCVFALFLLLSSAAFVVPAHAQMHRNFPATAMRGAIVFGDPPEVAVNGVPARLAPGARIRGADNMMVMSGALIGGRFLVHYTIDTSGLVHDLWILTPAEAAVKPWPTTPEQLQDWRFDPIAQVWTQP